MSYKPVTIGETFLTIGNAFADLGTSVRAGAELLGKAAAETSRFYHNNFAAPYHAIRNGFSPRSRPFTGKAIMLPLEIRMMIFKGHSQYILSTYSPTEQDTLGYLPGFGTIAGIVRILNALFVLSVTIVIKLKDKLCGEERMPTWYTQSIDSNYMFFFKNILRGMIELVPFVGGGALFFYDRHRLYKIYEETVGKKARELGIENFV